MNLLCVSLNILNTILLSLLIINLFVRDVLQPKAKEVAVSAMDVVKDTSRMPSTRIRAKFNLEKELNVGEIIELEGEGEFDMAKFVSDQTEE